MISAVEGSIAGHVSAALCHAASCTVFFGSLPPALVVALVDNDKTVADSEGEILGETAAFPLKAFRGPMFTATSSHRCLSSIRNNAAGNLIT